jgi:hypothetical protein
MKGIKILVFKSFNIVFVKSMVGEWCEILIIHKQYKNEKIFMPKKNIDFHNYIIYIHSFNPKPSCD